MATGMEQQIREMREALQAQEQRFQQQLQQSQEAQRQQLAALETLVTQQRTAGSELQAEVASQQSELQAQQRAGSGLVQEIAAQRREGQELLVQRDQLRVLGQELESERAGLQEQGAAMRGEGAALQRRVVELEQQVLTLTNQNAAAAAALQASAESFERLQTEHEATLRGLEEARASGAGGSSGGDAGVHSGQAVDWRLLATVFADDKAPKFGALASTQDALEHAWGDFAFIFERKFCQVCKGDAAEVIRFAEAQGDPEITPVSLEAVAAAGYAEQSRALYDAISSSCHMGSAPMRAVRKLQASKNGCAAWQALHFKYRPHPSGNDEVDKELLRTEHSVP